MAGAGDACWCEVRGGVVTALQRLQDAITKLERREVQGTYGNWMIEVDKTDSASIATTRFSWTKYELETLTIAEGIRTENADLIVMLHRTIDAQLSILAYGATLVGPIPECILALADSILDGEQ
jgi:hypothetical protein